MLTIWKCCHYQCCQLPISRRSLDTSTLTLKTGTGNTGYWQHSRRPCAPSTQTLRRERTKGAQQNIIRCAPFCIRLYCRFGGVWCGTPVSLTYLAASARKQLNAPSYAPTAPTIGLSYKLHNNTSIFLPRTFPLFPHTI